MTSSRSSKRAARSRDRTDSRRRRKAASSASDSSGSRSRSSSSSASSSSSSSSSGSSSRSRSRTRSPARSRSRSRKSRSRSRSASASSRSSSARSRRSGSASPARRRSSPYNRKAPPSPKNSKIHVGRLTKNVTKEHVREIFSMYGVIKEVIMPMDRTHSHLSRGFAWVEFEKPEEAEKAIKYMDGGQVDGQEITTSLVLAHKGPRFGGPPRGRGGIPNWARSSMSRRGGRRSPPRYRPRRSRTRSRSPRRRRGSSSD
ncbi:uncharacterized protein LOC141850123 isoform X2 [Brevipalpus obovatus]|uniref:uncharacterized protein LOC141850123 isoform X2 n=1 Tax=Brevipalpus obovatus TaxID=246614 RepID=UPI003D9FA94C